MREDGERTALTHAESLDQAPRKGCVLFFQLGDFIHSFIHSIKAQAPWTGSYFPIGLGIEPGTLYMLCSGLSLTTALALKRA